MSEFSDSFHLRTDRVDDGVALLRRASVEGFVFPPEAGWTAVVAAGDGSAVVAANTGRLLHYSWASDHGCSVIAYARARVASLEVSFEKPKVTFEREAFVLHRFLDAARAKQLEAWLEGAPPRKAAGLASAFGLTRFAWFSWVYEQDALEPVEGRLELTRAAPRRKPASPPSDLTDELQALAEVTDILTRRGR